MTGPAAPAVPGAPDGQEGFTLVEQLVATLVSMILLSLVAVVLSSSVGASRKATATVTATADARLAMDAVGRRLRVAGRPAAGGAMFTEATASSMTFTANLSVPGSTADQPPSTVRYVVDTTRRCLLETITPATGTARSNCLATGDVTPVFRYYRVTKRPTDAEPSPSPAPTSPLPLGSTGLSASDMGLVGAVEVDLQVRATGAATGSRPVALRSRFLLVNWLNEEPA